MHRWTLGALGATLMLVPATAMAQEQPRHEVALGLLQHGTTPPFNRDAPPGTYYEGTEEQGSVDVQLLYRTPPLRFALKPRLAAKAQVNTRGRTSFASVGAEWRQHILRGRVYGQIGIGVTVHDGHLFNADPFEPGLSRDEAQRRYDVSTTRTAFGSRILFNPNLSVGVRVGPRWAIEAMYEHFSHNQWFSQQNSGSDNVGIRLVRTLGR